MDTLFVRLRKRLCIPVIIKPWQTHETNYQQIRSITTGLCA